MKLSHRSDYLSIEYFDEVELPNFVVLTGVNGSGKSHLLDAIEKRSVAVDGDTSSKVVRFDGKDFYLEGEGTYNARQIIDERNGAWNTFRDQIKSNVEQFRSDLGAGYQEIKLVCNQTGKNFMSLNQADLGSEELYNLYNKYRRSFSGFFNQPQFSNNSQAQGIRAVANKINFSIDEISHSQFEEYFQPYSLKNDFLPTQIGRVIWDYYVKLRSNEVNEFHNSKYGKDYPVLSEEDFIRRYGDRPWTLINNILNRFGTIEYRLPSPEGSDYFGDFQAKLIHPKTERKIDFQSLSSGEKVLMALISSVYKASSDEQFPDLLLLDEVDASLHPSMIINLLDTIEDIFLARGTKVILVTHSPTTVALAEDASVYVMNKTGKQRIQKRPKEEALNILTEGYATLDEGLRIFDAVSKERISIITEGNNRNLIEKALELNKIDGVEVISGVEGVSGETQLNTIFHFLSKIPHPNKEVLVVWDCDVKNSFASTNNTHPFILPTNERNQLATKGIENMFEEKLFEGFTTTVVRSTGEKLTHFDSARKKDFEKHLLKRNDLSDFSNFHTLMKRIKELK